MKIVKQFFDALVLPRSPRARIKIGYGIAYSMPKRALVQTLRLWKRSRERRLKKLIALDAPQCILDNERRILKGSWVRKLLEKRLAEVV